MVDISVQVLLLWVHSILFQSRTDYSLDSTRFTYGLNETFFLNILLGLFSFGRLDISRSSKIVLSNRLEKEGR
jgi:hypothetical protein